MGTGGLGAGDGYGGYRAQLVETLRDKGIRNLAVLHAVATVPRHRFVPDAVRHRAYEDSALPIAAGQTISQPYVQARSLELLRLCSTDRVLEVGAGSGYQTALLAALASTVLAVERLQVSPRRPGRPWRPLAYPMPVSWSVTVRWAGGCTLPMTRS